MRAIFESTFNIAYLVTAITLGIIILKGAKKQEFKLFGWMILILGLGDAFHLIPRTYGLVSGTMDTALTAMYLGGGKFVTSITMTVFYLILFKIWQVHFNKKDSEKLQYAVWALAILRIIICLMPQNEWLSMDPSYAFGIYRNIPFVIMGIIIVMALFIDGRRSNDKSFIKIAIAVFLSFLMYLPVVLFAKEFNWVGMLMIPKTLAYVWIMIIGYKLYKKESLIE